VHDATASGSSTTTTRGAVAGTDGETSSGDEAPHPASPRRTPASSTARPFALKEDHKSNEWEAPRSRTGTRSARRRKSHPGAVRVVSSSPVRAPLGEGSWLDSHTTLPDGDTWVRPGLFAKYCWHKRRPPILLSEEMSFRFSTHIDPIVP
jgi:hypothetical protein